ncbi:MAG: 50S ribosome-binding GTPase [Planctomycetes bacterium]|nr:50S ribosome-binding GTPase [Planctomycetota bacterium]
MNPYSSHEPHDPEPTGPVAALLTPLGRGAVATIRVIGSCTLFDRGDAAIFRPANGRKLREQAVLRAVYGQWGDDLSEDVVVCRIDDTTTEIHCHGGNAATERILSQLRMLGCRTVSWVELSQRCKGVFQSECGEALCRARTVRTADILWEQQSGVLRNAIAALIETADPLRAQAADSQSVNCESTLTTLRCGIDALLQWSDFGRHLTQPWRVVIAGPPNVGKSSLINALVGFDRAIVFDQPGTTRDVVTAETAFDGWPVELCDTAGIRETDEELESAGILRARKTLQEADCRVLLLDQSRPRDDTAAELLSDWPNSLVVAHKCDLPCRWQEPPPPEFHRVSALTGEGVEPLISAVIDELIPNVPPPVTPIPVSVGQIEQLTQVRDALDRGDFSCVLVGLSDCLL